MTNKLTIWLAVTTVGITTGCTTTGSVDRKGVTSDGEACTCDGDLISYLPQSGDRDECKVEGSAIGVVGAQVTTGGVTVTFESWIPKEGEPNEFVGFTISSTVPVGALSYTVKTGTATYPGEGAEWIHPLGIGSGVNAISNVDFCDPDGGGDDGGGDDGAGDDCQEPDGCQDGGGSDDGSGDDGSGDDGSGDDGSGDDSASDECYCDPGAEDDAGDKGSGDDGDGSGDDGDGCTEPDGCGDGGGSDGAGDDGSGDEGCTEPDGCGDAGGSDGDGGSGGAGFDQPPFLDGDDAASDGFGDVFVDEGGGGGTCTDPDGCPGTGPGDVE